MSPKLAGEGIDAGGATVAGFAGVGVAGDGELVVGTSTTFAGRLVRYQIAATAPTASKAAMIFCDPVIVDTFILVWRELTRR